MQMHFDSLSDLGKYMEYLDAIDTAHYAAVNRRKGLDKVIVLPLDNTGGMHLGFTEQEFEELKGVIRGYLSKELKISTVGNGFTFGIWNRKNASPN
jgi:hypothetical protein